MYGLNVVSDEAIPGLRSIEAGQSPDLYVHFRTAAPREILEAAVSRWLPDAYADHPEEFAFVAWRDATGSVFRIRYGDGTEFLVDESGSATHVWISWLEPFTLADAATYLIGPVIGLLLRRRGHLCLHASCVATESGAFALMGRAGAGKSTTASAFARLGYPVLADDITTLVENRGSFQALPGHPRLCLWPTSARELFGEADALPRITPNWDKRYFELDSSTGLFPEGPRRLEAIYVLERREAQQGIPRLSEVPPGAAVMTLVAHTYGNRLLDRAARAAEFAALDRLVRSVPVRRVVPDSDLAGLAGLCAAILEDFAQLTTAAAAR